MPRPKTSLSSPATRIRRTHRARPPEEPEEPAIRVTVTYSTGDDSGALQKFAEYAMQMIEARRKST